MENFGKFMTVLLTMIISAICAGFVLMQLWSWIIVPIFGFQLLSLSHSVGLSFFINFVLKGKSKEPDGDFWKSFVKNIINSLTIWVLSLLIGWIISFFM